MNLKIKIQYIGTAFLLIGFSNAAFAQKPPTGDKSHVTVEGVSSSQEKMTLNRLETAKKDLLTEQDEIKKLLTTTTDNCDKEELLLRQQDAEFLAKNADQIQEVITRVRKGLRIQLGIIKGFQNGSTQGEVQQDYTDANGLPDKSVMIEFTEFNEANKPVLKKIPVKELMKYIAKFESEAKSVSDDSKAIEQFLEKYKNQATENDPAYYYMTLDQATKAYKERLSSVFQKSYREEQSRSLQIGYGKSLFRVTTTTTLGWDPVYNTKVGTLLQSAQADQSKMSLNLVQNFGESLQQAAEDQYWEVLRAQQLTIDGIPVDGYLRRIYFDGLRSPECQKKKAYTFSDKTAPGPFQSYKEKETCTKNGIEILTASMTKTHDYGGKARTGSVFDITNDMKKEANGKTTVTSSSGFYPMVQSLGMGSCDDANLRITYRCSCERKDREFTLHYKMNRSVSFGCN